MTTIPIYQVDAFTSQPFQGNPAAVCLLKKPLPSTTMQNIAMEINLSETAFVYPLDLTQNLYHLRWFTPAVEVPLCGHATLATSKVLFDIIGVEGDTIRYQTQSGLLQAKQHHQRIVLDFPADQPQPLAETTRNDLLQALGLPTCLQAVYGPKTKQIVIQTDNEDIVHNLKPNFVALKAVPLNNRAGVAVTAKSQTYDFISRFFDPWEGVNEDPVTGSVHTLLAPFWATQLNKQCFQAYQASARGGKLNITLQQDRVAIAGAATIVLKGEFILE